MKLRMWLILGLVVVAGSVVAFAVGTLGRPAASDASPSSEGIPVVVALPTRPDLREVLTVSGHLEPAATVQVTPKVPGRIEQLFVDTGSAVLRNALLARLESESAQLQVDQARATVQAAQAQLDRVRQGARPEEIASARASLGQAEADLAAADEDFARSSRLYEAGTLARSDFEAARRGLAAARTELENARRSLSVLEQGARTEELQALQANVGGAQAQMNLASLQVTNSEVRAPVGGVVTNMYVDAGNQIGTSSAILAIVQDDPIVARVNVAERHYASILAARLSTVRVLPIAFPGSQFIGQVTSVGSVIDSRSRTFSVEMRVANDNRELRPGMFINAELELRRIEAALAVSAAALVTRDGQIGVFHVIEGRARFAAVRPGLRESIGDLHLVEILDGLTGDEAVIVDGNAFLEADQRVRVLERVQLIAPADQAGP